MARKHLLIDIASDIFDEICCKWLRLNDVLLLDAAFAKNGLRAEYLEVLRSAKGSLQLGNREPTCSLLSWIWSRGIAVDHLDLIPSVLMFCQCQNEVQTHFVFSHATDLCLKRDMSRDDIKFCMKIIKRTTTKWVHLTCLYIHEGMCDKLRELVHCLMPLSTNLVEIHLGSCPKIHCSFSRGYKGVCPGFLQDEDVALIARSCPRLTAFDAEHAHQLTGIAIKALADHSHSLRKLKLRFARLIGNSLHLFELSQFAANMTTLELTVNHISLVQVACLLSHLPRLLKLVLREWRSHSQSDQDHLRMAIAEYCPFCELIPPLITEHSFRYEF
jgi:hypothetical protein